MKIKELIDFVECRRKQISVSIPVFPNDNDLKKIHKIYYSIAQILKKREAYQPKKQFYGKSKIPFHRCKCGACFIDSEFDGFCGRCGQRLRWKND